MSIYIKAWFSNSAGLLGLRYIETEDNACPWYIVFSPTCCLLIFATYSSFVWNFTVLDSVVGQLVLDELVRHKFSKLGLLYFPLYKIAWLHQAYAHIYSTSALTTLGFFVLTKLLNFLKNGDLHGRSKRYSISLGVSQRNPWIKCEAEEVQGQERSGSYAPNFTTLVPTKC